jgi:hypothetical protein
MRLFGISFDAEKAMPSMICLLLMAVGLIGFRLLRGQLVDRWAAVMQRVAANEASAIEAADTATRGTLDAGARPARGSI